MFQMLAHHAYQTQVPNLSVFVKAKISNMRYSQVQTHYCLLIALVDLMRIDFCFMVSYHTNKPIEDFS